LTLCVQRKHHKLIVVGRRLGRCPCWHRWYPLHRLPLRAIPSKCPERAHSYNHSRSMYPRIKVDVRVHPPKQHSGPKGKPDGGSNELKLAQAKDYLEPAPYGEHEAEPIERHHEHEYYRNGPHFHILSTGMCRSAV